MKICVLGKRGSIINWAESAAAAWRAAGHEVLHAVIRDPRLHPAAERLLFAPLLGAPRAKAIARQIRRFAPDMIVAIGTYDVPLSLLDELRRSPGLPPLFGWVGDLFGDAAVLRASYFAAIGYTDSGLLALHRARGLASAALFLPHAANAGFTAPGSSVPRDLRLVFVATPTPLRRQTVAAVAQPMVLYGGGWGQAPAGLHEIHAQRIGIEQVGAVYQRHASVLNIRNEHNVLTGLNQRSFDPYLCGAAVVSDAQPDLEQCFDPGAEVLVWRDADELNALYARLLHDPALAAGVAARGRQRVLAQHTYTARLQQFIALAR